MSSLLTRHCDAVATAHWFPLVRYGLACLSVACALLLTLLVPEIHVRTPFLLYILAVAVSSLYGGLVRPACSRARPASCSWLGVANSRCAANLNAFPLHTAAFVVIATIIVLSTYGLRQSRQRLVSERQGYEARLRYQAFLLDNVNDAVCVIDRDQRITYWNHGAETLYGWTEAEAVGRHMGELVRTVISPEERRTILAAIDAGERQRVELLHHNRAGEPINVEANVSALHGDDGSPIGYVTINRDVTDRKKYEQELVGLSTTLEERVRERTVDLERSNRELDQFAFVASHDLKAPLRAIALLAEWITEDAAAVLSPKSLQHLDKLNGRVKRMERLLDDLLAYSRVGRTHQPPERVDTRLLVQETVDLLNLPSTFQVVLPGAMPVLFTERVPLATVFRNLIQNAYKHHDHAERGCVTITVADLGLQFNSI